MMSLSTDWTLTLNIGNFRCQGNILVRIDITKGNVIDIMSDNFGNNPTKWRRWWNVGKNNKLADYCSVKSGYQTPHLNEKSINICVSKEYKWIQWK